jgi:hypothetical protein
MSATNATEQFNKFDKRAVEGLRDPIKRSAGLKLARRLLVFDAIGTVVLFAMSQILILAALYGQLYQDVATFFWAVPAAMMFLSLSLLGFFSSAKAYADVKAIHVYEALLHDKTVESEK